MLEKLNSELTSSGIKVIYH
jgi:pyridoxine 5'-phosphate synthase PdxJ